MAAFLRSAVAALGRVVDHTAIRRCWIADPPVAFPMKLRSSFLHELGPGSARLGKTRSLRWIVLMAGGLGQVALHERERIITLPVSPLCTKV